MTRTRCGQLPCNLPLGPTLGHLVSALTADRHPGWPLLQPCWSHHTWARCHPLSPARLLIAIKHKVPLQHYIDDYSQRKAFCPSGGESSEVLCTVTYPLALETQGYCARLIGNQALCIFILNMQI